MSWEQLVRLSVWKFMSGCRLEPFENLMQHKYPLFEVEQGLGECLWSQCFNSSVVGTLVSMGVLEAQQPKGRAPMGGYWLACEVSRSLTLRGESKLLSFNTENAPKAIKITRAMKPTAAASCPCVLEWIEWMKKKKSQSLFWEPTHLLPGVVRDVHVV